MSASLQSMSREKFSQIVDTLAQVDKPLLATNTQPKQASPAETLPRQNASSFEKKLVIINEIDENSLPSFIDQCLQNKRVDLTLLLLEVKRMMYAQKVEENKWDLKLLAALAAKKVIKSKSLTELQSLPRDIQERFLHALTLTPENFGIIFRWLEQLNKPVTLADGSKKRTQQPVDLSREQYASLGSVACRMHYTFESVHELVKQLEHFSGYNGKIKIELARWLILSRASELSNFNRFRLGWLLACNEQMDEVREVLFELLVTLLSRLHAGQLGTIPPCFCNFEGDIVGWKTRLKILYEIVQRIKNKTITLKELLEARIKDYTPDSCLFSNDYILRAIDARRSMLSKHGQRGKVTDGYKKTIDFLAKLLSSRGKMPVEDPLKKDEKLFGVLELLRFLCFSKIDVPCLFKDEQDLMRKKALNEKFVQCATNLEQESKSIEDFRTAMLMLLEEGADINAQDKKGDTVLHHAIRQKCHVRLSFLICLRNEEENIVLDFHRPNNAGITPAMELRRSTLQMSSFSMFDRLAKQCGVTFSREQLMPLVKTELYPTYDAVMASSQIHRILKIDDNEGRLRYRAACWYMNDEHSPLNLYECIELGWLLALKETKQERIDAILDELKQKLERTKPYIIDERQLPQVFSCTQDLSALYKLVKGLQEGTIALSSAFDGSAPEYKPSGVEPQFFAVPLSPVLLTKLLRYSGCYKRCLNHRKYNERLTETLLAKAHSMSDANETDIKHQNAWELCMLIAQGADINAQDISGNTVIHYCILRDNDLALNLLVDLFKECIDLTLVNSAHCTPLHLAARYKHSEYLRPLLDQIDPINEELPTNVNQIPVNAGAVDKNGYKALHYVLMNGSSNFALTRKLYELATAECTCSEVACQSAFQKLLENIRKVHEGGYNGIGV